VAGYTIFLQSTAWTDQIDAMMRDIERVDDLLNQLADDAVFPILARNYDASGIKQGGVFGGRHVGLLKPAITKRGAFGNIVKVAGSTLTVGVSYQAVPYARWVIEGRGPVRAKNKKMLHWIDPDTGKDVFRKSVGPAPPHPVYFLSPGDLKEIEAHLAQLIEAKVK